MNNEFVTGCVRCVDSITAELTGILDMIEDTFCSQLEEVKAVFTEKLHQSSLVLLQNQTMMHQRVEDLTDKVIQYQSKNPDSKVKLNLRGTVFTTTEGTLTTPTFGQNDTFFTVMLGSGRWAPDQDGEYYIDRSPVVFDHVLDYLCDGVLMLEDIGPCKHAQLFKELQFYQIPIDRIYNQRLRWLEEDIQNASDVVTYNMCTGVLTKVQNRGQKKAIDFRATPLHKIAQGQDVIRWKVHAKSHDKELSAWWIGIANEELDRDSWLTVTPQNGLLYENTGRNGEEVFPSVEGCVERTVEFLYCRSEGSVTISIEGFNVTRKLSPDVVADPCPCASMNSGSSNGTIEIEFVAGGNWTDNHVPPKFHDTPPTHHHLHLHHPTQPKSPPPCALVSQSAV